MVREVGVWWSELGCPAVQVARRTQTVKHTGMRRDAYKGALGPPPAAMERRPRSHLHPLEGNGRDSWKGEGGWLRAGEKQTLIITGEGVNGAGQGMARSVPLLCADLWARLCFGG